VSAATQVYYPSFDAVFLKLPGALRAPIEANTMKSDAASNRFHIID